MCVAVLSNVSFISLVIDFKSNTLRRKHFERRQKNVGTGRVFQLVVSRFGLLSFACVRRVETMKLEPYDVPKSSVRKAARGGVSHISLGTNASTVIFNFLSNARGKERKPTPDAAFIYRLMFYSFRTRAALVTLIPVAPISPYAYIHTLVYVIVSIRNIVIQSQSYKKTHSGPARIRLLLLHTRCVRFSRSADFGPLTSPVDNKQYAARTTNTISLYLCLGDF